MIDVVTLVNFDNPRRAAYLDKSFSSFYRFNQSNTRHLVFDSSKTLGPQADRYKQFGVEVFHRPGMPFGERLKLAVDQVREKYFVFLPDDFSWIFDFPLREAIRACELSRIAELKMSCRGMRWFSKPGSTPEPWFRGDTVISGETLRREGDLLVSRRWLLRDFHEQFSLACNLLETGFARWVVRRISGQVRSPGEAERQAYVWLLFRRYAVAYYKMWIPAFHFIDLEVEARNSKNQEKAETSLIEANYEAYNRSFNV